MNEHEPTEDLLSALIDGELDLAAKAAVEAHLGSSSEWQLALTEISETRAALRALGPVEAPDGFWERVVHDVEGLEHEPVEREPVEREGVALALFSDRARRHRTGSGHRPARRPARRQVAILAGVAATFVVGVAAVPGATPDPVTPPVGAFSQSHATRSAVGDDAISTLASAVVSRFGQ